MTCLRGYSTMLQLMNSMFHREHEDSKRGKSVIVCCNPHFESEMMTEAWILQVRSTAMGLGHLSGRVGIICGSLTIGALIDHYCSIPLVLVTH